MKSIKGLLNKGVAMDDLDDEGKHNLGSKARIHELEDDKEEGQSGEEKLARLTENPQMGGLLKFTQAATARDMRKNGIPIDVMQRIFIEDEWQMSSCLSLPLTIFFFVMFMLFFQQHYSTSFIHVQESNQRANFGLQAEEVNDIAGIYAYMKTSLIPYLWSTNTNPGAANYKPNYANGGEFQELMSGFIVRTQRSKMEDCSDEIVKDHYKCFSQNTVNKSGTPVQELPGLGPIGGWEEGGKKRRLDGKGAEDDEEESSWYEAIADRLNRWFPRSSRYKKVGTWKKTWEVSPDGHVTHSDEYNVAPDGTVTSLRPDGHQRFADAPSPRKSFPREETFRNTKSSAAHRSEKAARKSRKPKQAWQKKMKGWRPFKSMKRLIDPMAELDQNEASAPVRELRGSRAEFKLGSWIPYAYPQKDYWQIIVPMSTPEFEAKALVDDWQKGQVIDRSTLFFSVEAILRNENIGNGMVSHNFINFVFSRGGHIYVEVSIQSVVLKDEYSTLFFAFVWVVTLVANSIGTPARTCAAFKRKKLCTHLKRFWNLLEWFLTLYGWLIVLSFMMERWGTRKFNTQYKEYARDRPGTPAAELEAFDTKWFTKFRQNLYYTTTIDSFLMTNVAYYHVFLILRFFVASRGQPRLAIVVNTMRDASVDLAHLFIVFGIIFIAYVISGHILFGRRMENFSTVEGALAYTIKIVLEKQFEFLKLTEQDFWTALIWVYTFVLLVVLVLVNIVLAMIFDTYGEVRGHITEDDSLLHTFRRIALQIRMGSKWVSNKELLYASKECTKDVINAETLKSLCPGITTGQIGHLFQKAHLKVETMMTQGNKNALPEAIASVLIGIAALQDGVKVMRSGAPPKKYSCVSKSTVVQKIDMTALEEMEDDEEEENYVTDTHGQPIWVKEGLLPFLKKQHKFFDEARHEVDALEIKMQGLGAGNNIPACPYPKPADPLDETDVNEPFLPSYINYLEKDYVSVERKNLVAPLPPESAQPAKVGQMMPEKE